jgi:hypothetical protein
VQALVETIASLQQIKIGLEETKAFRSAQAERERGLTNAKGNRMLQLFPMRASSPSALFE